MSLRARLVIGLAVLTLVGLAAADAATFTSLRSFLLGRVDEQLVEAQQPVIRALRGAHFGGADPRGRFLPPLGTYAEVRDPSGTPEAAVSFEFGDSAAVHPDLPASITVAQEGTRTFTSGHYRVLASALSTGETLLIAIPLRDVTQTLHRLVIVEIGVTVAVLVGLLLLSNWAVGIGLRPLSRITGTAGEIAAGDLDRRVEPADERTEVGRLGVALNSMLGRLEDAFAERRATEDRLRRFVADASHELRTPLTSIRGYAELFRRGADRRPEDLAKTMKRIEDEAARMGVLVDDLLLLARLDQGRPLEHGRVDLTTIAADAVADASVVDPDRPIELVAAAPIAVEGDDARLRQVVANLVGNALRHTPTHTPVRVTVGEDAGAAVLSVADEGPGLTPDEVAHAFDRFYRGDPSRHRDTGDTSGSGLGLAIVQAVVAAHGGQVDVVSSPGRGATFRVRLPLLRAPESEPATR